MVNTVKENYKVLGKSDNHVDLAWEGWERSPRGSGTLVMKWRWNRKWTGKGVKRGALEAESPVCGRVLRTVKAMRQWHIQSVQRKHTTWGWRGSPSWACWGFWTFSKFWTIDVLEEGNNTFGCWTEGGVKGGERKSELVNYFGSLGRSPMMNVEMGQLYLHWRYNFFSGRIWKPWWWLRRKEKIVNSGIHGFLWLVLFAKLWNKLRKKNIFPSTFS